jgi:hypothetical protein
MSGKSEACLGAVGPNPPSCQGTIGPSLRAVRP